MVVNRDLARYIAKRADLTEEESRTVVAALLEYLADSLQRGERVVIRNLGTFIPYERKERTYAVPGLSQNVVKGPSRYVRFRPGRYLLAALNRRAGQ
jgi:nucleoid DNA-binding protein